MTLLALLLVAVGVADLLPTGHGRATRAVPVAVATAVLAGLALGLGLAWHTAWVAAVGCAIVAIWRHGGSHRRYRGASLGTGAVAALAAAAFGQEVPVDTEPPMADWYRSLDVPGLADVDLVRFVLGAGVVLFCLGSANVVVRAVLDGLGPDLLSEEQTVRGGRVLGPLERVFVVALALAGQFGALAAIVAAKGVLRYPEISKDEPDGSKAEYVLVGTFVSWAVALVWVPLF